MGNGYVYVRHRFPLQTRSEPVRYRNRPERRQSGYGTIPPRISFRNPYGLRRDWMRCAPVRSQSRFPGSAWWFKRAWSSRPVRSVPLGQTCTAIASVEASSNDGRFGLNPNPRAKRRTILRDYWGSHCPRTIEPVAICDVLRHHEDGPHSVHSTNIELGYCR